MQEVLTKPELEKRLRISNVTLAQLITEGAFPNAFQIRRHWRIPLTDVLTFEARTKRKNEEKTAAAPAD